MASPDTALEIQGIAKGSEQSDSDIVLRSGSELLQRKCDNGCSAVALRVSTGALVAQNCDAPAHKRPELALFLHFSRSAFEFAVVASVGGLGWVEMNRYGLALVNNDLILNGYREGIPSQVVRRILLEMPDLSSAKNALADLPHMGGRSYLIGDAGEVSAADVSAKRKLPATGRNSNYTNNALLPATRDEENRAALCRTYPSSAARLSALDKALARENLDVEGAKRVLCDRTGSPDAVCSPHQRKNRPRPRFRSSWIAVAVKSTWPPESLP